MKRLLSLLSVSIFLSACSATYNPLEDYEQVNPANQLKAPPAREFADFSPEQVEQGRYLVGILGCGSCHTNGALVGTPDMSQLLAGSDIGVAYSNPLANRKPGVVYPANLTPDHETGIGQWSVPQVIAMLQAGVNKHGDQTLPVMPWPAYASIHADDAEAIAAYLLSLPPVRHQVPENVLPGRTADHPYVHFGVYQSK